MDKGLETGGKNNLTNKRIVQIAHIISHGGIPTHVINLLDILPKFGAKVTLIGIYDKKNSQLSGDYIPITNKRNPNGYTYLFNLWLKAPLLKIASTDVICTHRPDDMFPFILFHRENPKVCTLHGKIFENVYIKHEKSIAKIYEIVEKFTLKRLSNHDASSIIAVDESTKRYFISKYPWLKNKIKVIPIGIDLNKFKPMDKEEMRRKYGFNAKDKIIIYIGRLEREKNLEFLIKSFALVKEHDPHTKLVFVGDGREKTHLKNLVDGLKLKDIIFMGAMKHDKIPEVLNCADVLALTSLYESGPLVIIEVLACGVPAVTVDVGRVREFIQNKYCGRIVERDEQTFANAISEFFTIDKVKTREECTNTAKKFSFEETANKTMDVYKEVCDVSLN